MAIMVGVTGVIFSLVDPSRGTYRAQPEVSDMQQRLRVGTDVPHQRPGDGRRGGAGGRHAVGSLLNYFAPIQPYRVGMDRTRTPRPASSIATDAITLMYIPSNAPQTTLSEAMPQPSSEVKVKRSRTATRASRLPLCGFQRVSASSSSTKPARRTT